MTEPVPVSGEDQPDPRGSALARVLVATSFGVIVDGPELTSAVRKLLIAADAADRTAGIRRVTEDYGRVLKWAAWDDGYEAARTGQQPHNPHRQSSGSCPACCRAYGDPGVTCHPTAAAGWVCNRTVEAGS